MWTGRLRIFSRPPRSWEGWRGAPPATNLVDVHNPSSVLDFATPVTRIDIHLPCGRASPPTQRYYLFHPSEDILSTDTAWHESMDNTVDPGDPAYFLLEPLGLYPVPIHADDVSLMSAPGLHIVEQETNNTEQIIHDEDLEHMLDLDLENAREEPDDIDHDGTPRDSVSAAITNQPPDLRQSLNVLPPVSQSRAPPPLLVKRGKRGRRGELSSLLPQKAVPSRTQPARAAKKPARNAKRSSDDDRSISVQQLVDPAAFECPKCKKPEADFTKRPQFERHIKGCILGKLHSCWVCAEEKKVAFARFDALQRHFEAKHPWAPVPSRKG
ncbi:hypothetical protein IEO21_01984 [Rhodonia placenta]|uniref:Uncharacterized protein n=1 Tax=Rhodonia placenta TaxID=104341 RepID=A0A8H7P8N3_9APHY|nr:hypothetical protein IEO21_01984 [Postia placenta]